jgi:hypothetical protein
MAHFSVAGSHSWGPLVTVLPQPTSPQPTHNEGVDWKLTDDDVREYFHLGAFGHIQTPARVNFPVGDTPDTKELIAETRATVNDAVAMLHVLGWSNLADKLLIATDQLFAALSSLPPTQQEWGYTHTNSTTTITPIDRTQNRFPTEAEARQYMDGDLRWSLPLFIVTRRVTPWVPAPTDKEDDK